MALFKTKQYAIISSVINRISVAINQIDQSNLPNQQHAASTQELMLNVVDIVVGEICIEFTKDNHRFNETLFRAHCNKINFIKQAGE